MIAVPGGNTVPIRAKHGSPDEKSLAKNGYYIRVPGPESRQIQTGEEWGKLLRRCILSSREELLDDIRNLLLGEKKSEDVDGSRLAARKRDERPETSEDTGVDSLGKFTKDSKQRWGMLVEARGLDSHSAARFPHGSRTVAYRVLGEFRRPSLPALRDIIQGVKGHETGWPPWLSLSGQEPSPHPFEGNLECWLFNKQFDDSPAHQDFWRASPDGMLFLVRGYEEDQNGCSSQGKEFDLTLPVWRVGECLLHAQRFALAIAPDSAEVQFRVVWKGLKGRQLVSRYRTVFPGRVSRQDRVESEIRVGAQGIGSNLAQLTWTLTRDLYEAFDLMVFPREAVAEELKRMLSGQ